MKRFFSGALGLSLALILGSCGAGDKTVKNDTKKELKIAMVTDVGGVNDQGFNQSAWEGLQKAQKELGVKISYQESKQATDYGTNIETLKDAKNDLIWAIGFLMADQVSEKAKLNPNQNFAIIDFDFGDKTPANVVGVMFKAQEPSFLVGYIAGKMTKTNKVGFIGGIRGAIIDQFDYGFQAGVKTANPKATILNQYAESFTDAAKGKSIATSMYQQGADILFAAAGATGNGAIEAAKEQNHWVIGVDRDQNYLAPKNVLTSALKLVGQGVFNLVKEVVEGSFKGGRTVTYGLAEGGVDVAKTGGLVPDDVWTEVGKVKADILSGKIAVPYDKATFDEFTAMKK